MSDSYKTYTSNESVKARKATEDETVVSFSGPQHITSGDYVLEDGTVVPADEFEAKYVAKPKKAKATKTTATKPKTTKPSKTTKPKPKK